MNYDAIQWYDDYVRRMHRILKIETKFTDDKEIIPNIYKFDSEAKYEWEKIYNEISIMQNSDEENEYMKSMLPKQKSYIPRFALLLHVINNIENSKIPSEINKKTILDSWELSKYFIKQAKNVKISEKETKKLKSLITIHKDSNPKDIFFAMLQKDEKINYTKIAEILNITRATLYNWKSEFDKKV